MVKNGKLYYIDKPEKEVKLGKSCYVAGGTCQVYYYKAITSITFIDDTFTITTESGNTKCFHYDKLRPTTITYSYFKDGKKFNTDWKVFASKDEAFESASLERMMFR